MDLLLTEQCLFTAFPYDGGMLLTVKGGVHFLVEEVCSVYPDEGAGVCHFIKQLLLPLLLRLMAAGLAAGMH